MIAACLLVTAPPPPPTMEEFLGLNTHTVQFRPALYAPVAKNIRNYHPVEWDTGKEPSEMPTFPMAKNQVDWKQIYGSWKDAGYRSIATLMFETNPMATWKRYPDALPAYAGAFARYFGPSHRNYVEGVEIGNEPVDVSDEDYVRVFREMADAFRGADPKLKIAPCATVVGDWDKYSRDIKLLTPYKDKFDAISVHSYAFTEHWPTWRRTYPEDPKTKFLTAIKDVISYRDKQLPGKEIWLTEFGWDSTTKPPEKTGDFAKFEPTSDLDQARYLVRASLIFARHKIDRAYIYWFNDRDEAKLHAGSGITRNYEPKPSFHALAHMQSILGGSFFSRVVREDAAGVYVYEFLSRRSPEKRTWVIWSPTGSNQKASVTIKLPSAKEISVSAMPTTPAAVTTKAASAPDGTITFEASESPTYVQFIQPR